MPFTRGSQKSRIRFLTLNLWLPNIIELILTLNRGSRRCKNQVKEPTLNWRFFAGFLCENLQFFEFFSRFRIRVGFVTLNFFEKLLSKVL
jgi:hypothetical protein